MKKTVKNLLKTPQSLLLVCLLAISLYGCSPTTGNTPNNTSNTENTQTDTGSAQTDKSSIESDSTSTDSAISSISLDDIPEYSSDASIAINGNIPFFSDEEKTRTDAFETYSSLDSLGRCGVAYANICPELMPTEERGEIGSVKPSGWVQNKYPDIIKESPSYLYNRCHLIAFCLAGENANEKNLITGTRYLNIEGMLPYEEKVANYVDSTENHVLYRVTPIFEDNNLLASGVLMEAYSVEDQGSGICFCIYAYNVQPQITIDYATGENHASTEDESTGNISSNSSENSSNVANTSSSDNSDATEYSYVINKNTKVFHSPNCSSINQMKDTNKIYSSESRDALISEGYSPCGNCNP